MLAVSQYVDIPVVLLLPPHRPTQADAKAPSDSDNRLAAPLEEKAWRLDAAHELPSGLTPFRLGRNRLAVPERGPDHHQRIVSRLEGLPDSFDFAEPFGRIRDAIEEARRGGQ